MKSSIFFYFLKKQNKSELQKNFFSLKFFLKKIKETERQRMESLENDVNEMKNDLNEIKNLLRVLANESK